MAPRRTLFPPEREAIRRFFQQGGNAILLNEPNTTTDIAELQPPAGY